MAEVCVSVVFSHPPQEVWKFIRDFNSLPL